MFASQSANDVLITKVQRQSCCRGLKSTDSFAQNKSNGKYKGFEIPPFKKGLNDKKNVFAIGFSPTFVIFGTLDYFISMW